MKSHFESVMLMTSTSIQSSIDTQHELSCTTNVFLGKMCLLIDHFRNNKTKTNVHKCFVVVKYQHSHNEMGHFESSSRGRENRRQTRRKEKDE